MSGDRLHVVFGAGQVGSALAAYLAGLGIAVRAVSRHRPPALAGVDWRAADAADPEAAADAAKGASVIYLAVTTGIAAGVILLGTAAAGFHDLAAIRAARLPGRASLGTKG